MDYTRFAIRRAVLSLALFLAFCLSASAARADRLFLYVEDAPGHAVAGDSADRAHAKWIVAESFNWGGTQPVNRSAGGGAVGRPTFTDLRIVKRLDRASAVLSAAGLGGKHLPRAVLEVCRQSGDRTFCYYRVTLTDVFITSYQVGGSAATGPTEEVSFNYSKIRWELFAQDPTGRIIPVGSGGWDTQKNMQASLLPRRSGEITAEGDRPRRLAVSG